MSHLNEEFIDYTESNRRHAVTSPWHRFPTRRSGLTPLPIVVVCSMGVCVSIQGSGCSGHGCMLVAISELKNLHRINEGHIFDFVKQFLEDCSTIMSVETEKRIIPADIELKTVAHDPRFPNQNQTKFCYTSYLDYHRCRKARGTEYEPCNYFKKVITVMCPNAWVEKWDTQREEGVFPARI